MWLQEGDNNTEYIHSWANKGQKSNTISKLKDYQGNWVDWDSGLHILMKNYFINLFYSSSVNCSPVTTCIERRVSGDMNNCLLALVERDEVKRALFQMHPAKSSGPDDFNPGFFQKFWELIGDDITNLVQQFFINGEFPNHLNDTHMVLIPKKAKPNTMNDLRPIALCNILYIILSKVLANCLKGVLPSVITENQIAFLPRRLI